ncbi:MAG: glycosyltransferase family 4 protein [Alphaproteobacteria bacterium]|nr:glycosyltransferase family 4 protein [Alphaproteobacteria bacterium]
MLSNCDVPFGTEKVAYKYTDLFLKQGHEVLFVHKNIYDQNNVDKKHPKLTFLQMKNKGVLGLMRARLFLRRWKPDVIIVHNFFSQMRFVGFGIAPMIGIAHLEKFKSMRTYEGVVSLRPDSVERAISQGVPESKISVIPNTCNLTGKIRQKPWGKLPVIGSMGRLSPAKNVSTLIKALGILKRKGSLFKAVLAGQGEDRPDLEALVKTEGLEKDVAFLGFVQDSKTFYESIDIFCVPSLFEPFGLVVLEAMFAKKPIVASSVTSFQQILANKTALLSDTMSAASFAKNLDWMLKNPKEAKAMADRAHERYQNNYSEEIVYKKLMTLIEKIKKKG